jgi:hypothetical protein
MSLVTENSGTCEASSDHVHACDTCAEASAEIHSASESIESWAAAIARFATEARRTDDADERDTLLAVIEGLAWAIEARANTDITGVSLSEDALAHRAARIGRIGTAPTAPASE